MEEEGPMACFNWNSFENGLACDSSLIRTQGFGDIFRIYVEAQGVDIDYNLAHIPSDFQERPKEEFDPEYMQKLFDLGYGLAKNGYPWLKAPPGVEAP
jgi:hypothetical protein